MAVTTLGRPAADELTHVSFPIEKWDTTDDGDLVVYGKATDGSVDSDMQIVDPDWAKTAVPEWLKTGGNVRMAHNAHQPVGVGLEVELLGDAVHVKTLVVDPVAKRLVEKGVLRAYSVGIARPVVERDITGKARGGIIKGGELAEISLVDRPANRNCAFTLVKAAASGEPEWVGKMEGDAAFLARFSSPADVARVVKQRKDAGLIQRTYSDPAAQRLADALAAEVPEFAEKRDFSAGERHEAAESGAAMPDGSFPIHNKSDLSNAIRLAGHAKDPDAARAHIKRRAADLKVPEMIPDTWKTEGADVLLKILAAGVIDGMLGAGGRDGLLAKAGSAGTGEHDSGSAPAGDRDDEDDTGMPDDAGSSSKAAKPFGGKKAMPFGKKPKDGKKPADGDDDDDGDGDDSSSKAAALRQQIAQLQAELAKCVPTVGVQGTPAAQPVPGHRGGGSMDCGPDVIHPDQTWGKAMDRTTDAPYAIQRVHDATCAAYDPMAVKAAYPALAHPGAACDPGPLQEAALAAIAGGDLDGGEKLLAVAKAAEFLSKADPLEVADAMAGLRKSFTDMYPSVRLSPGQIMPQKFQRPYITDGHARVPSPSGDTSPGTVPAYHPDAADFRRGPLTAGEQAPSPGNKGNSNPYPAGSPVSQVLGHAAASQQASAALRTIHDYHAAQWNGVCPMTMDSGPVTSVPALAGKGKKKKSRKPPAEMAPMDPVPAMPGEPSRMKAAGVEGADITAMLARVERRLKKLGEQHEAQLGEITKGYETRMQSQAAEIATLRRNVDALGSQPDTTGAPPRSVAKAASTVVPALRRNLVDEAGEQIRAEKLAFASYLAASGDPAAREAANAQIRRLTT